MGNKHIVQIVPIHKSITSIIYLFVHNSTKSWSSWHSYIQGKHIAPGNLSFSVQVRQAYNACRFMYPCNKKVQLKHIHCTFLRRVYKPKSKCNCRFRTPRVSDWLVQSQHSDRWCTRQARPPDHLRSRWKNFPQTRTWLGNDWLGRNTHVDYCGTMKYN